MYPGPVAPFKRHQPTVLGSLSPVCKVSVLFLSRSFKLGLACFTGYRPPHLYIFRRLHKHQETIDHES